MKQNHIIIVMLVVSILVTGLFFDSVVTGIILVSFSNFFLNGIVFSSECGVGEDPTVTGCYDKDHIDGSQVLNCLHGGSCPIGVSYEPTQQEDCSDPSFYGKVDACPLDPVADAITLELQTNDDDGDGILNQYDQCPTQKVINPTLTSNGCPVGSEPDVELDNLTIDIITNPPPVSSSFLVEQLQAIDPNTGLPVTLSSLDGTFNLNNAVDSAIILVVVILVILILALIMVLKKNLPGKKKRR